MNGGEEKEGLDSWRSDVKKEKECDGESQGVVNDEREEEARGTGIKKERGEKYR